MCIFTYCSYRSSHYGFQYCCFSSECTDTKLSFFSLSECKEEIPDEFSQWCENYSGWQLVVMRLKDNFLLMVNQLEKSRELEKKYPKKNDNLNLDENSFDSDYYMTLGFLGSTEEIKKITSAMLNEYKKDGYRELFGELEKTISKTDDSTRYKIDTKEFNSTVRKTLDNSPSFSNSSLKNNFLDKMVSKNHFLGKMVQKFVSSLYLSCTKAKSQKIDLKMRKKNIDKCIEMISDFDNLSGIIPLLIAYDYFRVDDKIYIRIDYEYLWY